MSESVVLGIESAVWAELVGFVTEEGRQGGRSPLVCGEEVWWSPCGADSELEKDVSPFSGLECAVGCVHVVMLT